MKVPGVGRNLVPDTWTADGEGALPKLGPCPHDSCVGCRGMELAMSRFFSVEFDVVEVCWPMLIKNGVHHGGDLELCEEGMIGHRMCIS